MNWLDRFLTKFTWYNYPMGEVLSRGRQIKGIHNEGLLQWRIKQTRDGAGKFISLFAWPSFYYGSRAPAKLNCYLDLDLDAARQSLADLNAIIQILEKETR
jgi:hypothetical protein